MKYTATYSPDDNKMRLYASSRLDAETYERVKSAGFKWAPKQELFVAPAWSPGREDLLIELAGEIEDEDKSLVERAEERAERFEEYSENRTKDAEAAHKAVRAIADHIPFGQPILVGHHSEKRARKDAEKIHNGMRKAVKMWDQAEYWTRRAAGSVRAAKYKELPAVRARRIKKIEADLRKVQKGKKDSEWELKAWIAVRGINDPEKQRVLALQVANRSGYWSMKFPLADFPRDPPASQYEGDMGIWSALDGNVISPQKACELLIPRLEASLQRRQRWIDHYENRLAYERAMLAEQGGTVADQTKPEKGGAIRSWHFASGWSYITKVNKVTVTVLEKTSYGERPYRANVPFDKISAIMSAAEVNMAKQEGRVQEVAAPNGVVVGFRLAPVEPPPPHEPKPEPEANPTVDKIEEMRAAVKNGPTKAVAVNQLFPTPKDLAQEAVDLAGIQPGHRVLEPSAGTGALLGAMGGRMFGHNPGCGAVTAIEINPGLAEHLTKEFPLTTVICADFLDMSGCTEDTKFDRIVMNPPFENGADLKHIEHALTMLKPGGRLVAICANGPRQNEKLKPKAASWKDIPSGTFNGTGVRTALITIDI